MSLTGITFANQKLTPSDDGRLYGAALDDGILSGCAITSAAATLSIAAGSLLIGTRELKTSGETVSVTGATSGYARVLVDIDLTKAATETTFAQAELQVEYAASESAFAALDQEDLNTSGTHYQAVLCVMTLGSAGITAITSKLGECSPASKTRIITENYTVWYTNWETDSESLYTDFPYRAPIYIEGATADMIPEVVFAPDAAMSGTFAPVAKSAAGIVYIYAAEAQTADMVVPTVILWR